MTDNSNTKPKTPIFSEKVYNAVKQAAQYWFPALGVLYAALAALWHFPYVIEVLGTITAVDTFLGVLLGISSAQYNRSDARFDGALTVNQTDGEQFHALQLNAGQYQALPGKDSITLKVLSTTPPANTTDPRLLS